MRVTLMARYYDADIPPLPYYPESVVGQIVLLVAAPHELYLALPWLDVALLGKLLLLSPCFSQLIRLVVVAVARHCFGSSVFGLGSRTKAQQFTVLLLSRFLCLVGILFRFLRS